MSLVTFKTIGSPGFSPFKHALEISERTYRHAIDAVDHVAFSHHRLTAGLNANLGHQSVWIDLLDEQTLNAGQMPDQQRVAASVPRV